MMGTNGNRSKWMLAWAGIAAACGGSSDLGGATSEAGGSPSGGGARPVPVATGGNRSGGAATGGWTTVLGGWGPSFGGYTVIWGGSATGGVHVGGTATGGATPRPVCQTVTTLPTQGTGCTTPGESRCLPQGDRCVCERGIWYCNTTCASSSPIPPVPDSPCTRGTACTYSDGSACACINYRWMCVDTPGCPGEPPPSGSDCSALTGVACDYPNSGGVHVACACLPESDAATPAWLCVVSAPCPATQPTYPSTCSAIALCTYGSIRCGCALSSTNWVCL